MQKKGLAHQVTKILGLVILMQLMFVAGQGLQVSTSGLEFTVATAHADLTSDVSGIGSGDPFQKAGQKAQSMLTSLTNVAVPFLALAIACLAIAMFKGRIDPNKAIIMIIGGFVIGSALAIATWVIK